MVLKTMSFIRDLIKQNTGVSSKSFTLVSAIFIASISILSFIVMLFIDLLTDKSIQSDMYGMSAVITALGGLVGAAFYAKVKSEETEFKNKKSK
jgi:competence protein ComGC